MSTILVTGGAGYIGSHMLPALRRLGYRTLVFDSLTEGHREAVGESELIIGNLGDYGALRALIRANRPLAILHFAAVCSVAESVSEPLRYYDTNVAGTLNLVRAALEAGAPRIILSSTAAVYGEPKQVPIDESHPTVPINPYGWTKLAAERILADFAHAYGLRYVAFRYFNAAGADPANGLGEDHRPETHLVPLALRSALDLGDPLQVYGDDYPTPDGTCVRDYIHVKDLVDAHVRGLQYLLEGGDNGVFNLGTETGHSVRQIIDAVESVTQQTVEFEMAPRRPGDPAVLVASARKAREVLGWEPRHDLDAIVRTTLNWMQSHPNGYRDAEDETAAETWP
jgi:UDP-glucose 4-epimerase